MIDLAMKQREELVQGEADKSTGGALNENDARRLLEAMPGLGSNIRYNLDQNQPELGEAVKLSDTLTLPAGTIGDNEIAGLLMFFQSNGFERAKDPAIRTAVLWVAHKTEVTSFSRFIAQAREVGKVRPGIFRDLMVTKLGAADVPYSPFWLRSLMGAILQHQSFDEHNGGQFVRVPYRYFMFGAQGIGKSFMLTRLSFGLEFTFDGDPESKDTKLLLAGNVIANADDTATQQTKRVDAIKSAITTPYYNIRLPYAKSNTRLRNRAVFVGSTNRLQAYTDTTGDRREMPIDLNVGMSEHDAELHGKEWVGAMLKDDPNYFLDLWATFLAENDTAPIAVSAYSVPGMDDARREVIDRHHRESDLTYIITSVLTARVGSDFATLDKDNAGKALKAAIDNPIANDADIDPFTGEPIGTVAVGDLPEILATVIIKAVKQEYGAKISRSTIVEAMNDHGYTENRHSGTRTFVKKQEATS